MERKIETFFRKWQKDIIRKPLILYGPKQVKKITGLCIIKGGSIKVPNSKHFETKIQFEYLVNKILVISNIDDYLYLFKENKINKNVILIFISVSAFFKFILDYFRMSHVTQVLSINQIVSVIFIVFCITFIFINKRKSFKN